METRHENCVLPAFIVLTTSKTPYVAIDERGWVRSVHLLVCVHYAVKYYIVVCPV